MEKGIKEFISSLVSTSTNTWVILKDTLYIGSCYSKPKFPDKSHLWVWGTLCQLALNLLADATKCLLSTIQQNHHPLSLHFIKYFRFLNNCQVFTTSVSLQPSLGTQDFPPTIDIHGRSSDYNTIHAWLTNPCGLQQSRWWVSRP